MSNFPTFGTGTGDSTTTINIDGNAFQFESVAARDSFFTTAPTVLKTGLPIAVNIGDNQVMNEIWTGEGAPTSYNAATDAVYFVAASVVAATSSFYLGGIHILSSAGENISFRNTDTDVSYFPPWQFVGDHREETGRVVGARPLARRYGDLTFEEPRGAVAVTGSVPYSTDFTLERNESVFGVKIVPAEDYTGMLEYRVTRMETVVVSYNQFMDVNTVAGTELELWFPFPTEGRSGVQVQVEIFKPDGTILNVRPLEVDGSIPYTEIRFREFDDMALGYAEDNFDYSARAVSLTESEIINTVNESNFDSQFLYAPSSLLDVDSTLTLGDGLTLNGFDIINLHQGDLIINGGEGVVINGEASLTLPPMASGRLISHPVLTNNYIFLFHSMGTRDDVTVLQEQVQRLRGDLDTLANSAFNSGRAFTRFNASFVIDNTNLATYTDRNILYTAAIDKVTNVHLPSDADIAAAGISYPVVMEFTHLGGTARLEGSGTNVVRITIADGNSDLTADNVALLQRDDVVIVEKSGVGQAWTAATSNLDPSSTLLPSGVFELQTDVVITDITEIETELSTESIQTGEAYLVETGGVWFGETILDGSVIVALIDNPSLATASEDWLVIENGIGANTNEQLLFLNQIARTGTRFDLSDQVFVAPENVITQTNIASGTPAAASIFTPNSQTEETLDLGTIPIQFTELVGGNLRMEFTLNTQASSGFTPEFRELILTFGDVSFSYNLVGQDTDVFNTLDVQIPSQDYSNAINTDMTASLRYIERGAQWLGNIRFISLTNTLTGTLHAPIEALIDAEAAMIRTEIETESLEVDSRLDGINTALATIRGQLSHPTLTLPDAVVGILTNDIDVQQEDNVTRVPSQYNLQLGGGNGTGALVETGSPVSATGQTDLAPINAAPVGRRGMKLIYPILADIVDGGVLLQSRVAQVTPLITREGDNLVAKRVVPERAGGLSSVTHYPLPANQVRHDWFTISAKTASLQPVASELFFVNDIPSTSTTLTIFSRGLANGNPFGAQTITLNGVGGGSDVSTSYTETVGGETLNVTVTYRASRNDIVVEVTPVLTQQFALADLQVRLEWTEQIVIPSTPRTTEDVIIAPYVNFSMIPMVIKPSQVRADGDDTTLVIVTPDVEIDTGQSFNLLFNTTDSGRLEILVEDISVFDINFNASSVTVAELDTRVTNPYFGLFTDNHTEGTVVDLDTQLRVRSPQGTVINVGSDLILEAPDTTLYQIIVDDSGDLSTLKL